VSHQNGRSITGARAMTDAVAPASAFARIGLGSFGTACAVKALIWLGMTFRVVLSIVTLVATSQIAATTPRVATEGPPVESRWPAC
jgi:hypothetical protein